MKKNLTILAMHLAAVTGFCQVDQWNRLGPNFTSERLALGVSIAPGISDPRLRVTGSHGVDISQPEYIFTIENLNNTGHGLLINASNNAFRIPHSSLSLYDVFVIQGSGSVGIGTSLPEATLHIRNASNASTLDNTLMLKSSTRQSDNASIIHNGITGDWYIRSAKPYGKIFFQDTGGNVGIGQAEPLYKVDVNGIINASGILVNGTSFAGGGSQWGMSGATIYFDQINGKVGIGTSNPDHRLTVKGGIIHAEEILVNPTVPAPDYVFEKDYRLPPLSELEAFIVQNKHLPDVPSACAMSVEGLDLGTMNFTLLKKVEELTLYLIEQQKARNALRSRIKAMEQNVSAKN